MIVRWEGDWSLEACKRFVAKMQSPEAQIVRDRLAAARKPKKTKEKGNDTG